MAMVKKRWMALCSAVCLAVLLFQTGCDQKRSAVGVSVVVLRVRAEQGDADAQYTLGRYNLDGTLGKTNAEEAVKWFLKAAEKDHMLSQYMLSLCYFRGMGVKEDHSEGAKWCRKSADRHYTLACYFLGNCYFRGDGVKTNLVEGLKLVREAADQGMPEAQLDLGNCYFSGFAVRQDRAEAARYYKMASDRNFVLAQLALGHCYDKGFGVEKNPQEALKLYRMGAESGDARAENNLAWTLAVSPDDSIRDGKAAIKWATRACEAEKFKERNSIDTLAAAYAEAGDFGQAVKYQKMAMAMPDPRAAKSVQQDMEKRLALYQSGKAYHEE